MNATTQMGTAMATARDVFFGGVLSGEVSEIVVSVMNKEGNKTPRKDNAGKEGDKGEYLVE